jgi:hypothetical protein
MEINSRKEESESVPGTTGLLMEELDRTNFLTTRTWDATPAGGRASKPASLPNRVPQVSRRTTTR